MTVSDVGLIFLAAFPAIVALAYWQEIACHVRRLIGRDRVLHVVRPRLNSAELYLERRRQEGAEAIRQHARGRR